MVRNNIVGYCTLKSHYSIICTYRGYHGKQHQYLSSYLIPESDYYNTMMRSKYESITWVREREITFRGMDIYDCIPLSDGSYLCSVEYRLSIQYTNTLYEPDTVCVLHIVPYEGGYRVAVMTNKI